MTEFVLRTERDRQRVLGYIQKLDLKTRPHRFSILEWREHRSDAQNRLMWKWNGIIMRHMADTHGLYASVKDWHECMVERLVPTPIAALQLPDGFMYQAGRARTSDFNVKEMGEYLDRLDHYCAEELGLLLPHPDDYELAVYGERRRP